MSILIGLLTVIHVLVALCLIGLVLMQKSKDQGVGAAFGAGVTETVFGAGTTTAMTTDTTMAAGTIITTVTTTITHTRTSTGKAPSAGVVSSRSASRAGFFRALRPWS